MISLGCSSITISQVVKKSPLSNITLSNKNKLSGKLRNAVASFSAITGYDKEKLKALQKQLEATNKKHKEEAIEFANTNNIPLKRIKEDGGLVELMRILPDGTLLYNETTSNVAAAISTRANYLNTGGGLGLDLNGDGLTAYVWDGGHARVTHQEYDGAGGNNRVSIGDSPLNLNFHAAHVTGTIVASGVQANAKGMAWQANTISYDWNNDTGEVTTATLSGTNNNFGVLISNHSYGFGMRDQNGNPQLPAWFFGRYFDTARDWDQVMYDAPYYLMVGSAGNDGTDNTANSAPLNGNALYDKLSGFKVAKNNLVVASGDDAVIAADGSLISVRRSVTNNPPNSFSSEGPTDDFRIKPDILGNGTNLTSTYESSNTAYGTISGTSMASPNVAGTLLLIQEYYYDLYSTYMLSATLRGLALHTADDVTPSNTDNAISLALVGPDATTGWGLLNAKKAAETIAEFNAGGDAIIEERTLNNGSSYAMDILANGTEPLQVSITWTDPAGPVLTSTTPNITTPVLVNDLDARLTQAANTFYPWRLTSVNTNANNTENNVDNIERIDIANPSGIYTLNIDHDGSLSSGSQDYTIIVTGGRLAPTGAEIAFTSISGSAPENSDCSFTDYNVDLSIGAAPSANAEITFNIDGASTATEGVDFDLITPSVTFPSISSANRTLIFRVYEDGFVEGDETIIINTSLNANGGDATLNASLDTYTFSIDNDDLVPSSGGAITLLDEDFETIPVGWSIADRDGDGIIGS